MLDTTAIRSTFPSLSRSVGGRPAAYLDGPGGTQVHASVIAAMSGFMERGGSNLHGSFVSSAETDAVVGGARSAVADLFGATSEEIAFGQNMTSITYSVSRAIARTWSAGDNVVVTRLDHDANVAPWLQAAADRGAEARFIDFLPDQGCQLDLASFEALVDHRTRLVACTLASNAVGTITPIDRVVDIAHAAGALTYVDAVHYAPHGLVDVVGADTDFLVASAYKWFGPHTGCLYGKGDLLASFEPYKLRPSPDTAPDRWETGTQSFESLTGVTAAVDYIASLGHGPTRRDRIVSAYDAIRTHETHLSDRFLARIAETPGVRLFGEAGSAGRTPTFAISVDGRSPDETAAILGEAGCFVWSGDYYAYEVMRRLGQPEGLVRIGFVHYNTVDEVDRVVDMIQDLV